MVNPAFAKVNNRLCVRQMVEVDGFDSSVTKGDSEDAAILNPVGYSVVNITLSGKGLSGPGWPVEAGDAGSAPSCRLLAFGATAINPASSALSSIRDMKLTENC